MKSMMWFAAFRAVVSYASRSTHDAAEQAANLAVSPPFDVAAGDDRVAAELAVDVDELGRKLEAAREAIVIVDANLRTARAAELEQFTRAQNAEMALEETRRALAQAQDELATAHALAKESMSLEDLRALLRSWQVDMEAYGPGLDPGQCVDELRTLITDHEPSFPHEPGVQSELDAQGNFAVAVADTRSRPIG